jgi:hypothetical protein
VQTAFSSFLNTNKKKSKNIQSNHTFKIFQTIDVALTQLHQRLRGFYNPSIFASNIKPTKID